MLTHNKLAVEAAKVAGVTQRDLGILRAAFPTCPKTSNAYREIKKRASATGAQFATFVNLYRFPFVLSFAQFLVPV